MIIAKKTYRKMIVSIVSRDYRNLFALRHNERSNDDR